MMLTPSLQSIAAVAAWLWVVVALTLWISL
jgi:hypothetical protein